MTPVTFRHADPADVPAVAALIERAYRGLSAELGWSNEAGLLTGPRTSEGEVADLIADPDCRMVLAERDDVLAGSALIRRVGADAYFGMFAIEPTLQAGGLGKALLARCEADARSLWNAGRLTMTVISLRHELIAWYERRGYARTGTVEPFPFGHASGALRDDFDLVELARPL